MRVVIIEDEAFAARRLASLLGTVYPEGKIVATLGSVREAVSWLSLHTADLIFADIQLSDGTSFNVFEQLDIAAPVIFTTAYDQYAIKAFEVNSIAYLLKPIRESELADSIAKFNKVKGAFQFDVGKLLQAFGKQENDRFKHRFLVRLGDQFKKVEVADIAYCMAIEKEVIGKTFANRIVPLEYSLDQLEQLLDPSQFFRINRRMMINIKAIKNMISLSRSRIKITLEPEPEESNDAIVSVQRSANFKKWIDS